MRLPLAATLLSLSCAHAPSVGQPLDARALRAQGPAGLARALASLDAASGVSQRLHLMGVVAQVAGQRDAHVSRLFWHEALDTALAAARESGKPVLSLRMLGRLDEELSCANSRFFRTTLYGNAEVSAYLREHFVLHWSSERPVPVVRIDFGDGRTVTRTITGNSIHYVLDAEGHVIDGLPGLYSANEFLAALRRAEPVARKSRALRGEARERVVADWHGAELQASLIRYEVDRKRAGLVGSARQLPSVPGLQNVDRWPSARDAIAMAMPKAMVEFPVVKQLVPDGGAQREVDPTPWARLARARASTLDATSRALVLSKDPVDVTSAKAPRLSPALEAQLITRLETSIDEDTVRNEYALHAVLRRWLRENPGVALTELNREVYARLFLTPATDPWLGLVPALVWTGLPGDGVEISRR